MRLEVERMCYRREREGDRIVNTREPSEEEAAVCTQRKEGVDPKVPSHEQSFSRVKRREGSFQIYHVIKILALLTS